MKKETIQKWIEEWVGDKPEHMPDPPEMEAAVDLVMYCIRRSRGEAMSSALFFKQGSEPQNG